MKFPLWQLASLLILTAAGPAAAARASHAPQHQNAQHSDQNQATRNQAARLTVTHAWIRVLPGALPGAGYATIQNRADAPAVIVAAGSRAYGHVMLHKSRVAHGVSQMVAVPRLTIPAHGTIQLQPGSYHLMMMHAIQPVQVGRMVPVTLQLADGSTLHVRFMARPANAGSDTQ